MGAMKEFICNIRYYLFARRHGIEWEANWYRYLIDGQIQDFKNRIKYYFKINKKNDSNELPF